MLLPNLIYAASIQPLNLIAVGRFQRGKDADVTRLELMRGVRQKSAQDYIMLKVEL